MRNDVFDSSSSIFECDKNKKLDPYVFMSQKGERNQMQGKKHCSQQYYKIEQTFNYHNF